MFFLTLSSKFLFRFSKIKSDSDYAVIGGIARDRIWRFQRSSPETISYQVLGRFGEAVEAEDESILKDYFQVDFSVLFAYFSFSWMSICRIFTNSGQMWTRISRLSWKIISKISVASEC